MFDKGKIYHVVFCLTIEKQFCEEYNRRISLMMVMVVIVVLCVEILEN